MNQLFPGGIQRFYVEQSTKVQARFDRMKSRDTILTVRNLEKVYRAGEREVNALHDINFSTYRREFLCVVGPSGCGKSTLARILAGLEERTAVELLLAGNPGAEPGS